jgi:PKD repeat protein
VFGNRGTVRLNLETAPSPVVEIGMLPVDPSSFDMVQFYDLSSDPGQVGIAAWAWDFGDGATATVERPLHRFAADGTYVVRLEITTGDGRTASTTRTVDVKTHDVVITSFEVPPRGRVGRTSILTVGIANNRYPERVSVELLKSIPGGFELVGTLTQSVPVRAGRRTTPFAFSYTFTDEDLAIGRVTFRARATIVGARDALSADNEAVSLPVKVIG